MRESCIVVPVLRQWLGAVVSEVTIKTHVSCILGKRGLRDRAQLVVAAYESGLVRQKVEETQ